MIFTFESLFGEEDRPRIAATSSRHNRKFASHTHTFYEMVYVLNGFTLHLSGTHATLLAAGDMFILPPGVEHTYVNAYRNGVLNFIFCPEDFADAFDAEDSLPGIKPLLTHPRDTEPVVVHVDISERRSVESIFEKICIERRERRPGWRTALRMRMVSLLIKYSRLYAAQYSEKHALSGGYSYVLRILAYVEKNYASDITVSHLAEEIGLNADYMSRRFKAIMGLSPSEYVRKFRVAKAMELLCTTDQSVTSIASACGFSDVCLFSRVFKNTAGVTPLEFRRGGAADME